MLPTLGTVCLPELKLAPAHPVMKQKADASRLESGCVEFIHPENPFDPGLIHM